LSRDRTQNIEIASGALGVVKLQLNPSQPWSLTKVENLQTSGRVVQPLTRSSKSKPEMTRAGGVIASRQKPAEFENHFA